MRTLIMKRAAIAAIAAGIGITTGACGGTGTWRIASCQVDVTYINDTTTADNYVPDTDTNFQQHFVPNQASGAAAMAVVVTFVNNTGGPASLPTRLVVFFKDPGGKSVGNPQSFNGPYGSAVTSGHGSGEAFSSSTLFNPGQTVAESPDIGASMPRRPDLSCSVSQQ